MEQGARLSSGVGGLLSRLNCHSEDVFVASHAIGSGEAAYPTLGPGAPVFVDGISLEAGRSADAFPY